MDIREETRGNVHILHVAGRLDNPGSQELSQIMIAIIEAGTHNLLVNLKQVTYLNSTGLRTLLDAQKKMQSQENKFLLCSTTGMVQRVIKLVGFDKLFNIYDTEEEALTHF